MPLASQFAGQESVSEALTATCHLDIVRCVAGTFVFAPFTQYLMDTYDGWRGACIILAGVFLNMVQQHLFS